MRLSHLPYVRSFSGTFQRLRRRSNWLLCALFFGLPWITWNDNPAILITLSKQQFQFFSLTFWPQDLPLLALLFMAAAFALFFITTLFGRVWCGFLCPQTVWSFAYLWIEEKLEGKANKRKRQDNLSLTKTLILRKTVKHMAWLVIALLTAIAFLGYFVPITHVIPNALQGELTAGQYVWLSIIAFATYFNAGWLRNLVCLHMCPYARFQSVMFDQQTLTVSYNQTRGEPRKPSRRDQHDTTQGDCIDCNLCVEVCPTGIDIREGLQYQCIDCGACVDACNHTMTRMKRPLNLIAYRAQMPKPLWQRPKLLGYGTVWIVIIGTFGVYWQQRTPVQFDILRDRQALFQVMEDGAIRNHYQLKITNKTQATQTYRFSVKPPFQWQGQQSLTLAGGEKQTLTVALDKWAKQSDPSIEPVDFTLHIEGTGESHQKAQRFLSR